MPNSCRRRLDYHNMCSPMSVYNYLVSPCLFFMSLSVLWLHFCLIQTQVCVTSVSSARVGRGYFAQSAWCKCESFQRRLYGKRLQQPRPVARQYVARRSVGRQSLARQSVADQSVGRQSYRSRSLIIFVHFVVAFGIPNAVTCCLQPSSLKNHFRGHIHIILCPTHVHAG
jgi:hypothetical protein